MRAGLGMKVDVLGVCCFWLWWWERGVRAGTNQRGGLIYTSTGGVSMFLKRKKDSERIESRKYDSF